MNWKGFGRKQMQHNHSIILYFFWRAEENDTNLQAG
jgi:hypothetical protein